jgi:hypothetical protein
MKFKEGLKTALRRTAVIVCCAGLTVLVLGGVFLGLYTAYHHHLTSVYNQGVQEGLSIGRSEGRSQGRAEVRKHLELLKKQADKAVQEAVARVERLERALSWHEVWATREGLVGKKTASGKVIKATDVFVALPSKSALGKQVCVEYNSKRVFCNVEDVGPWSTEDEYWFREGTRPASEQGERLPESMKKKYGIPKNMSGIDLSDGLWETLGIPKTQGLVYIKWRFVEMPDD